MWPFVIYFIMKTLNGFLMIQRQMTLKVYNVIKLHRPCTCGYLCWPTSLLLLYVVGQPQTNCSVTLRPTQTGLCMPMCLTTRKKRLVSRRPIWADTTPVDKRAQWEEDWLSASVVNSHLVCDPTIQQPGFVSTCRVTPGHC